MKQTICSVISSSVVYAASLFLPAMSHADDGPSFSETVDWITSKFTEYYDGGCRSEDQNYCTLSWSVEFSECHMTYDLIVYMYGLPSSVFHKYYEMPYASLKEVTFDSFLPIEGRKRLVFKTEGDEIRTRSGERDCSGERAATCFGVKVPRPDMRTGFSYLEIGAAGFYHKEPDLAPRMTRAFKHLAKLTSNRCEQEELF
ncbi:hypothetical protein [Tritonibacter mobilis]|uniref:hypothetical protein n=1 Tax=Tritonibacter mobilis TaxID=379347 RepID=UPI0013A5BC1F|nr:hypothetical protein [Tritonibacter mobilis]